MLNLENFLKDKEGKESLSRLLALGSFIAATAILAFHPSSESLGLYLGTFGAVYAAGKFADKPK